MRWFAGLLTGMGMALGTDEPERLHEAAAGWTVGAMWQGRSALEQFLAGNLQSSHARGQRQTKAE